MSHEPRKPNLECATTKELLDEIRARIEVDGKLDYRTSPVSGIKVHNDIQFLLDCEADCIKSGNSLSPKEQKVALDVIANIQQRMYGHKINLASFHKPEGGNPLDPDSNICDTAPYPSCNGANGCDTCENQPND